MSKTKRYAVDPQSVEGCRIRMLFHYKELQREVNSIVRANIAQYLAEATADLAQLEAEDSQRLLDR
jgi:hypothetical protein